MNTQVLTNKTLLQKPQLQLSNATTFPLCCISAHKNTHSNLSLQAKTKRRIVRSKAKKEDSTNNEEQKLKASLVKKQYPFDEIEPKWQNYWDQHRTFRTPLEIDVSKPKFYVLDMFPYPRESYTGVISTFSLFTGLLLAAHYKDLWAHPFLGSSTPKKPLKL